MPGPCSRERSSLRPRPASGLGSPRSHGAACSTRSAGDSSCAGRSFPGPGDAGAVPPFIRVPVRRHGQSAARFSASPAGAGRQRLCCESLRPAPATNRRFPHPLHPQPVPICLKIVHHGLVSSAPVRHTGPTLPPVPRFHAPHMAVPPWLYICGTPPIRLQNLKDSSGGRPRLTGTAPAIAPPAAVLDLALCVTCMPPHSSTFARPACFGGSK